MFKGLKNKIREETGNDVSHIAPIRNATTGSKHSRQGSSSSLSGFSLDGLHDDNNTPSTLIVVDSPSNSSDKNASPKEAKLLEKKEEEWKKKMKKAEEEWKKKFDKKEEEMRMKLEEKDRDWKKSLDAKERERKTLAEQMSLLEEEKKALELEMEQAELIKKKYCQLQEEREQLEGFQTQEMAKLKHLLLAKEQDIASKSTLLRESNAQVQALQSEIARLRRNEEELSTLQDEMEVLRHSSEHDQGQLRSELAQREEDLRHLRDRIAVLERRTSTDCIALGAPLSMDERVQGLLGERALLERKLEEAHLHLKEIKSSWSSKIASLETQVGRLSRQAGEEGAERRRAEQECQKLEQRVKQLEEDLVKATEDCTRLTSEKDELTERLEEQTKRQTQLEAELETAHRDKSDLSDKMAESERAVLKRDLEVEALKQRVETAEAESSSLKVEVLNKEDEFEKQAQLQDEVAALKVQLEEANEQVGAEKRRCSEMFQVLEAERRERDETLMRNAHVSQQVELSKRQIRTQESEMSDMSSRIESLEKLVSEKEKMLEESQKENERVRSQLLNIEKEQTAHNNSRELELKESLAAMEAELSSKNKNIRVLQQRLGDMKKTLQRELRLPSLADSGNNEESSAAGTAAVLAPSSSHQISQRKLQQQATSGIVPDHSDVNFQYLKHVLMKFLTSREYEAKHLTRAVATLLHFSPEEERLLRETLEWKMSWFGSKPNLGFGQTAKTIPPS